jgi:hypothetical protein
MISIPPIIKIIYLKMRIPLCMSGTKAGEKREGVPLDAAASPPDTSAPCAPPSHAPSRWDGCRPAGSQPGLKKRFIYILKEKTAKFIR